MIVSNRLGLWTALALSVGLTACSLNTSPFPTATVNGEAGLNRAGLETLLGDSLSTIDSSHVDSHSLRELTEIGLEALDATASDAELTWTGDSIRVEGPSGTRQVSAPTGNAQTYATTLTNSVLALAEVAPASVGNRSLNSVVDTILDAITAELAPFSYYLTPEEAARQAESVTGFVGVGIRVSPDETGLRIVSVIDDGPANAAGVRFGDLIVEIDGNPYSSFDSLEAFRATLGGREGTQVRLGLERNGERLDLNVRRAQVNPDAVDGRLANGNVGVLRIYGFDANTGQEMLAEMEQIKALLAEDETLAGWVLDLRSNPGGFLHEASAVLDAFSPSVPIYRVSTRTGSNTGVSGPDGDLDTPLVVLIDQWSASASEMVSASLKDNDRAVVLGSRSFGKGSIQSLFPVANGGLLGVTIGRFTGPSGARIDGVGVDPTICTANTSLVGQAFANAVRNGSVRTGTCEQAVFEEVDGLSRAIALLNDSAAYRRALDLN